MTNADGAIFYPVIHGVEQGDRVVTSGSFLVDAETRLNPAAGSIYFGNSSGSKSTSSVSNVRPTTPEDPQGKNQGGACQVVGRRSQLWFKSQKFCPILTSNLLGSMGPPVKVMVDGQPVFLVLQRLQTKSLGQSAGNAGESRGT